MNKEKLRNKTGGFCVLCGRYIEDDEELTREHIVPKSRGGKGAKNIQPAHSVCNEEKGDRTIEEWCEKLEYDKLEARKWQTYQLMQNQR